MDILESLVTIVLDLAVGMPGWSDGGHKKKEDNKTAGMLGRPINRTIY